MHKNDINSALKFFRGIYWLFRSYLNLLLVFFGYLIFFPIQLVCWLKSDKTFEKTDPYLFLNYWFERGTAFPGEKVDPYAEWKRKKLMDID